MSPPTLLMTSQGVTAKVRPYDGDDAASIIASVQHRTRSRSIANGSGFGAGGSFSAGGGGGEHSPIDERSEAPFASSSTSSATNAAALPGSGSPSRPGHRTSISNASASMDLAAHRRRPSVTASASLPAKPVAAAMFDAAQGGPSPARHLANAAAAERAAQAELAQMKVKAVEAAVQEEIEEQEEAEKNGNGNGEKGAGQHKGEQQESASASVGA
ncbi:hypothetical protein BCV69DRAFT_43751 [Microstroma glucosiphilum]|uniref:Uncharacterized protein n=1 Tax=Pseudomicrostroma glucosiphilum TaxID=1684307 RepID=A0A316U2P1_9BASI|nr:hypothetical protein BCV69DRAFT_43751 [Pseudomicrostroma glucosiphilum]PWN19586.1 hypothetical protein BCV69DRAFT_43751 [Pseudomicrostroma glucosiphilum]